MSQTASTHCYYHGELEVGCFTDTQCRYRDFLAMGAIKLLSVATYVRLIGSGTVPSRAENSVGCGTNG